MDMVLVEFTEAFDRGVDPELQMDLALGVVFDTVRGDDGGGVHNFRHGLWG
jgi:hypothetical protein